MDNYQRETFEEFKNSFSYGSRTDLTFKFLKSLSEEEAADFLTQLISATGDLLDEPSTDTLIDLVYRWQVRAYTPKDGSNRTYVYQDRPFARLRMPLEETVLGLVTSSGHFSRLDPPSAFSDSAQKSTSDLIDEHLRKAPELSEIPIGTSDAELGVMHPGYDTRSALKDPEVNLPIRALQSEEADGVIGGLARSAYSFVGACSQGHLRKELDGWIETWKSTGVEALFLVPV